MMMRNLLPIFLFLSVCVFTATVFGISDKERLLILKRAEANSRALTREGVTTLCPGTLLEDDEKASEFQGSVLEQRYGIDCIFEEDGEYLCRTKHGTWLRAFLNLDEKSHTNCYGCGVEHYFYDFVTMKPFIEQNQSSDFSFFDYPPKIYTTILSEFASPYLYFYFKRLVCQKDPRVVTSEDGNILLEDFKKRPSVEQLWKTLKSSNGVYPNNSPDSSLAKR